MSRFLTFFLGTLTASEFISIASITYYRLVDPVEYCSSTVCRNDTFVLIVIIECSKSNLLSAHSHRQSLVRDSPLPGYFAE